jgi:hypothetical protein
MATVAVARRIQRVGQFIVVIGGAVGLALWLFVFKGDLSRPLFCGRWVWAQ